MVMLAVATKHDAPTPEAKRMGLALKKLRNRQGLTQFQVGEALDLSHKTVSAYENGRAILGSDDFEPWATALRVSVAELTQALGLGLPEGAGDLTRGLAGLTSPDRGARIEAILRDLVGLPDDDQDQIINSLDDQVTGRHTNRKTSN